MLAINEFARLQTWLRSMSHRKVVHKVLNKPSPLLFRFLSTGSGTIEFGVARRASSSDVLVMKFVDDRTADEPES